MRLLKNWGQHPAQKVKKKMHTINNNKLIDNYSSRLVGEIEKGRKFAKERSVTLSQNQASNLYISIPNPGKNIQTTKKQSYVLIAASKLSQALENLWTQVKYKNQKFNSQYTSLHANGKYLRRRILFFQKTSLDP